MTTNQQPDAVRRAQIAAFVSDYQRMWDLVRVMRSELLDQDLITREEYAILLAEETKDSPGQGSPSPRRLESYDELRAELSRLSKTQEALRAETIAAQRAEEGMQQEVRDIVELCNRKLRRCEGAARLAVQNLQRLADDAQRGHPANFAEQIRDIADALARLTAAPEAQPEGEKRVTL